MPANLSPEYKEAQAAFRRAHEPRERLDCLKRMLRTIPKHKGTEHLQADIKTRVKELTAELAGPKKGGARCGPALTIRPDGAAQVALLGPPNVGKSSLHARLTGSHAVVGPYPYATKFPVPGMLPHEDIQFQLVDLPPISDDYMEPWMANAVQHADAACLVVDLGDPECVDQLTTIRHRLEERRVSLLEGLEPQRDSEERGDSGEEQLDEVFRIRLPTLLLANKSDQLPAPEDELVAFRELAGVRFPGLAVSAETGRGLDSVGPRLFEMLEVVRVYTKLPGHAPDRGQPYAVRARDTVREVAVQVHRGRAAELKFARLWSSFGYDGQQVGSHHPVHDGDVVELHW